MSVTHLQLLLYCNNWNTSVNFSLILCFVQISYLLPEHEIHGAVGVLHGAGDEAEGMILPPTLPLFGQAGLGDTGHRQRGLV